MATEPCMLPTTGQHGFDLVDDEMEIGIQGEKGIYREKIESIDLIIGRMMKEIEGQLDIKDSIVMLNGMGGTTDNELSVTTYYLNQYFEAQGTSIKNYMSVTL